MRASRPLTSPALARAMLLPLLAAALMILPSMAGDAEAQDGRSRAIAVEIDHSLRVQLRGSAASVIVGNPAIADVTIVDSGTLFITGRGYGVSQVTAVDSIGRTLFQGEVVVTAPTTGHVRVWRGASATDMACASTCAPSVRSAPQ